MGSEKETPIYHNEYKKLTIETRAHADVFNDVFNTLIDNDNYLKQELEEKIRMPTQKSLTIPNTGWIAETNGSYTQKLILAVEWIKSSSIVNVTINMESEEIAQDCGIASTNESGEGTITFYAESVPSTAIQATYYTLEVGGGEIG